MPGENGDRGRPLQGEQRPIGQLGDAHLGLEPGAQMGEIGVAAAGIDDQEQMIAGLADDQIVEDAAARVGELGVARPAGGQAHDVGRHQPLQRRRGLGAVEPDLAHVRDVEQGRRGAAVQVLGQDAGRVLHRHLPAGERHQTGAQLTMQCK